MLPSNEQILFTRQLHEAKKAGRHYDIRFVVGDKAYSFATKKELPEPGKAILLYEQPVHTAHYALSERVEIPDGQYGAGVTTLVDAFKAKVGDHSTPTQMTIESKAGRYLLKKVDDEKYGKTAWLFKNLDSGNKYLDKAAALNPELEAKFQPDLTPAQMKALGVLEGKYTTGSPEKNFFGVDASMKEWPEKWHNQEHPMGWYEWYQNYHKGKRTEDDERQIKRWLSFKARHLAQLKKADPTLSDLTVQPKRRQALLNWGIAPGVDPDKHLASNKYLEKVAHMLVSNVEQEEGITVNKYLEKIAASITEAHRVNGGVEYRGEKYPGFNKPKNAPAGDSHKKVVLAKKGDQIKVVRFGARGYGNNYSDKARKSYLARSAGIGHTNDKFSANHWARTKLWSKNSPVTKQP